MDDSTDTTIYGYDASTAQNIAQKLSLVFSAIDENKLLPIQQNDITIYSESINTSKEELKNNYEEINKSKKKYIIFITIGICAIVISLMYFSLVRKNHKSKMQEKNDN